MSHPVTFRLAGYRCLQRQNFSYTVSLRSFAELDCEEWAEGGAFRRSDHGYRTISPRLHSPLN